MKKRIFTFLFTILTILLMASCIAGAQEVIDSYDVVVDIKQNSSLSVTENIKIKVENIKIKHGLIRFFPVTYIDSSGKKTHVTWDVKDVTLNNEAIKWSVSQEGTHKLLRIGDPNKIIPPGTHLFTIKYNTEKQLGFYDKYDELYWNVTGNLWDFPINKASCKVTLLGEDSADTFNSIEWYVGSYGEKGKDTDATLVGNNRVATTRALGVKEGLTVVYTWPKGLVIPPPPPPTDNERAHGVVGSITLLALILWLVYAWHKWGREIPRRAVIPLFTPPNNETPSFMRFSRDLNVDKTALTSLILNLAVKGAIKIEEKKSKISLFGRGKSSYSLHKNNFEKSLMLQPEEDRVMMQLFPGAKNILDLNQSNSQSLVNAKNSMERYLKNYKKELFKSNLNKVFVGVLIYVLGLISLYPFSGEPPINLLFSGVSGLLIILPSIFLWGKIRKRKREIFSRFIIRLLFSLTIGVLAVNLVQARGNSPFTLILFLSAATIFSISRPFLSARTDVGNEALNNSEGLALYMNTAEKERLEMFNPPKETPELFETLMPYALALDVAKTWGNKFEKILSTENYQPSWYVGPNPYLFINNKGFYNFSTNFENQINNSLAASSMTSAPGSSSGFGGGGFSGGGGGGGGGSGW